MVDRKRREIRREVSGIWLGNTRLPETETVDDVVFHGAGRPRGRTESSLRPYRKGRFKYMLAHKP